MTKDLLLAIDNGTQSVRALIFDLQGQLVAKSQIHIEAYFSEKPGWAEQHPDYFWQKACEACQALWLAPTTDGQPLDKNRIAGVAVTTQRASVVNVDKDGNALRPAILWLDQRRTPINKRVGGLWGLAFKLIRMEETIDYFLSRAEARWINIHQPDIWNKTHKFLLLSGWLNYKLTGKFIDSVGSQVGYIPFDYKKQQWAGKNDWKWKVIPGTKEILPDLVKPGELIGEITEESSLLTGIPQGTPVMAAAADKACEILGSGGLEPDVGCLSYGTTATVNTTQKKYIEPQRFIPPYPSAVPGSYSTEIQIFRGFWMVNWFKNEFGHREQGLAEEKNVSVESLFDELVAEIPPGSMGLMLQPYWSPGVKMGREAKGSILGFGDVHKRGHFYRAILEGLAYSLRESMERVEKRTKTPITQLRVSGGGSQSDAAMQITADIFNLPAARPHTYETSGLGACIDIAVGLGLHPNFDTAVEKMVHTGQVFDPIPANAKIYDELYKRVYLKMYKQLQPLYKDIRDITGYPE
ncbi:FGGY-family carbohydrate kinase [Pelagibaculum spongiae]|uniref:Carbohydrate kinase n=1 Tax=Pelagibaculum spongiae TaxID=2080658 RepID=A0A2V1GY76_9GAMM|nr:FGGY-family carbohydrate kinase [Pelagibaculum spongiae]PVZ65610.1 carbohydrate kinase [Pelagibaculum spongiae]